MIADLTGALGTVYDPLRRQGRERTIGWTFHVDMSTRRQPTLLQPARDLLQHRRVEWRVEEDDVERLRRTQQEARRVLDDDGRPAARDRRKSRARHRATAPRDPALRCPRTDPGNARPRSVVAAS